MRPKQQLSRRDAVRPSSLLGDVIRIFSD